MRKIVLAGFLFISLYANGQFVKGDKFLGGSFSFYAQNPDNPNGGPTNKLRTFSLTPDMGFLISKNFAIGGQLGYTSIYQEISYFTSSKVELKSKSFSAGIFGQQYFNISDKFLFSLVGEFNFARGFETDYYLNPQLGEVVESKTKNYELRTSIRPTFIFFPSPKWGFEASIGAINHTFTRNLSTDAKENRFSFDYGTLTFGIAYYFLKANQ